jgi:hypothetical protein
MNLRGPVETRRAWGSLSHAVAGAAVAGVLLLVLGLRLVFRPTPGLCAAFAFTFRPRFGCFPGAAITPPPVAAWWQERGPARGASGPCARRP